MFVVSAAAAETLDKAASKTRYSADITYFIRVQRLGNHYIYIYIYMIIYYLLLI